MEKFPPNSNTSFGSNISKKREKKKNQKDTECIANQNEEIMEELQPLEPHSSISTSDRIHGNVNSFSTKSHISREKEDNSPSQDDKRKENALAKSRAKLNDSIRKVEERCRDVEN